MDKSPLDHRSRSILMQVVNDYITSAEPVGSRTISKKHREHLSPATIRNVMADLEDMGYLKQPHTSAGRIPTDLGYRYFVDELMSPNFLKTKLDRSPKNFDSELKESPLEDVLEKACSSLSQSSNQAGLVMLPSFSNMMFKHIEFIKVGPNEALAVFISDMGVMQNKVVPLEKPVTQEYLTSISNYLNEEFTGKSLKAIRKEILGRIESEREHYDKIKNKAMDLWTQMFSDTEDDGELLIEGSLNFFNHPELASDLEKMKSMFQALEEKTKLVKLLDLCLKQDGMTIIIGEESQDESMQDCSLIAQNYQLDEENMGTMAIFGPKRMDYQKIINLVDQTAKTVTQILSARNKRS